MNLQLADMRDGYVELVRYVRDNGEAVAPRGQPTREVLNATFTLHNPQDSFPVGIGRKPNLAIAAAEAIQLIGGFSDPEMMVSITKNFERFLDGGVLHGSYGPRIRTQLQSVEQRLRDDADTRQAIACIWDPLHDGLCAGAVPRDLPCTLILHFLIRRGKLDLCTTMRSNDVWLGTAYDVSMFTQLQLSLASVLEIEPGKYHHHAASLHIYDRNIEATEQLHAARDCASLHDVRQAEGIPHADGIAGMQWRALKVWDLELSEDELDQSERWYRYLLEPHVRASRGSTTHPR